LGNGRDGDRLVLEVLAKSKVLKDINLTIKEGEITVFIGPSGCGKTTTMKMINLKKHRKKNVNMVLWKAQKALKTS
jgi:ABC-type proline/glycine betaine transport system ATPase subunit